jgi:hypothetical protein
VHVHRAIRFGCAAALALACASATPEEQMAAWRESAVSEARWKGVRPHLEALRPGDDLDLLAGARQVHLRDDPKLPPVVVIPSWITSLSGGAAGGLSMFGQLVGRRGDRIYGSHVFGTVAGERIVPRHQLFTEATAIDEDEYERLAATGEGAGLGAVPRPGGRLFFRDLCVAGGRPLPAPEARGATLAPEALRSEAAYREILPILESLPVGTDLLSLLAAIDAVYLSDDFGESHSLRVRGFLHDGRTPTQTLETSEGVYKLRPFGWREGDREVVDRIAIFENDRLLRVVVHRGLDDWTLYLRELAGS